MSTTTTNRISPSKYDIEEKLLTIASKFTDITDTDYLKAGLFGAIIDMNASMMRDSTIHKNMLYNESFLNTAIMPKSIYNWAKMFNINITKATPAYATIKIQLDADGLTEYFKAASTYDTDYGTDVTGLGDTSILILDKSSPIIAGEYYFAIEHSILIKYSSTSGTYSAQYITTEPTTTEFETDYNKILSVDNSSSLISIYARAYQYKITTQTKQIASSSFLNTKIHTFTFDNEFAGATLYYSANNSDKEKIELYYSNIGVDSDNDFAYYSLNSDTELQIKFSSASDDFIPSANSTLYCTIFTTNGSDVPSTYSSDATFKQSDTDLRNLSIVVNFEPTTIIGGVDAPSLSNIKETIINEISTRDVIITESDLNKYFKILSALSESVSDGEITFIKKRDDILRRVFTAYVMMRDGTDSDDKEVTTSGYISKCMPTNTVDVTFPISSNISEPFGSAVKRTSGTTDSYEYTSSPTTDDYYNIPFYTRIILDPIKKVKYIYNLTDDTTTLAYLSTPTITSNTTDIYFTPDDVTVTRLIESSAASGTYTFSFLIKSNVNLQTVFANSSNSISLKMFSTNSSTSPIGIIEYPCSDIASSIDISEDDDGVISNTIVLSVDVDDEEFKFDSSSTSDFGTYINLNKNNTNISATEEIKVELDFEDVSLTNSSQVTMSMISSEYLSLFKNLDNIMFSDITVNYSDGYLNSGVATLIDDNYVSGTSTDIKMVSSVTVKDVPVVHNTYFSNTDNQTKFISQLFTFIEILQENLDKLETSTFFDLKFYNTYGPSRYYNTTTTNIDLGLTIYLKSEYTTDTDGTLAKEIRDYIRRAVDKSNDSGALRVSSIISLVNQTDAYGTYIDHIDFTGINGVYSPQYINSTGASVKLHAPEWLNIDKEYLTDIKFEIAS